MKNRFKKYLSILTIISVLFVQTIPVYAEDIPIGSEPTPSSSESAQPSQSSPLQDATSLHPSDSAKATTDTSDSAGQTPTPSAIPSPAPSVNSVPAIPSGRTDPLSDAEREARKQDAKAAWEQQFLTQHPELNKTNGSNGNTGSTTLKTGNATNSSAGVTLGNTNSSANIPQNGSSGTSAVNPSAGSGQVVGNTSASFGSAQDKGSVQGGAVSDNASAVTNGASAATDQTNSAKVGNNVNQSSVTGKSSTSFNVGDSTLTTGNSNVSGTAVTGVNTNLSNVQVSEFNVIDNQKGDLILSPEAFTTNCIAGCSPLRPSGFAGQAATGNGAQSTNSTNAVNNSDTTTTQTNNAGVGNNLTLAANSGDNTGSFNTGGDTTVTTGDANVSANSLTFANNNIAGGVTFGVVNIYGNLEGDIVLPEFASVGNSQTATQTSGNPSASFGSAQDKGSGQGGVLSNNTTGSDNTTNTNTLQNNDVNIANNVIVDGNTGNNDSNDNTSGNTTINTGKTTTDTNVLNIANSNVSNGTWWLVLVNHAGNWVGKLIGAPDGATMAGSAGTEFKTDANGQITASNAAGAATNAAGAASNNTTNVSSTTNTNTTQDNNADIQNNLNLSANTGNNRTDFNTGGHNTINTGDSNIIANLVNFVNNNISGNGKLAVTIVNVFGKWTGDFVTPGQQKAKTNQNAQTENTSSTQTNGQNNTTTTASQNSESATPQTTNTNQTRDDAIVSGFKKTPESQTQNFNQNSNTDTVKVAGLTTDAQTHPVKVAGTNEKIIRINLAWALLLIPFLSLYIILKKRNMSLFLRKK